MKNTGKKNHPFYNRRCTDFHRPGRKSPGSQPFKGEGGLPPPFRHPGILLSGKHRGCLQFFHGKTRLSHHIDDMCHALFNPKIFPDS